MHYKYINSLKPLMFTNKIRNICPHLAEIALSEVNERLGGIKEWLE
jgi:hypothetical protein